MSELGHEVWFWRRDAAAFAPVLNGGVIAVADHRGKRDVRIAHPTLSLSEAISCAEVILAPLPATSHEELAAVIAPLLREGQVVLLPPGTLGSVIFARALRASGNDANVSFAETGTLPYLVRKHGLASIVVSAYAKRLPTGVFPAINKALALEVLKVVYPAIEPVKDVLSAALMNAGPIIHPPLILMNAGPLEHFEAWDIHNEGTQRSIRRVTDSLDRERIAVRQTIGYGGPHFPLADHYSRDGDEWMYGHAAHERLTDSGDWRERVDLLTHRYMREDTLLGLALLVSIGHWAGEPTPIAAGLLAVASAITGAEADQAGRTLETLGLAQLNPRQMTTFLNYGY